MKNVSFQNCLPDCVHTGLFDNAETSTTIDEKKTRPNLSLDPLLLFSLPSYVCHRCHHRHSHSASMCTAGTQDKCRFVRAHIGNGYSKKSRMPDFSNSSAPYRRRIFEIPNKMYFLCLYNFVIFHSCKKDNVPSELGRQMRSLLTTCVCGSAF